MKKNRTFFILLYVLFASLITSCAILPRPYKAPQNGNIAYLRIAGPEGRDLPSVIYAFTFDNADNCKGRYNIQDIKWESKNAFSYIKIPSDKDFALSLHTSLVTGYSYCAPIISFVPKENRYYTAVFSIDSDANKCYLGLNSAISKSGEQLRNEPVEKRIFTNGFDESSSFCRPE